MTKKRSTSIKRELRATLIEYPRLGVLSTVSELYNTRFTGNVFIDQPPFFRELSVMLEALPEKVRIQGVSFGFDSGVLYIELRLDRKAGNDSKVVRHNLFAAGGHLQPFTAFKFRDILIALFHSRKAFSYITDPHLWSQYSRLGGPARSFTLPSNALGQGRRGTVATMELPTTQFGLHFFQLPNDQGELLGVPMDGLVFDVLKDCIQVRRGALELYYMWELNGFDRMVETVIRDWARSAPSRMSDDWSQLTFTPL